MREKIRDIDHLRNILNFTEELLEVRSRHTLESLQKDKVFFYGVVKEVEMIGEAAYQLTNEFRESHREVPWRVMNAALSTHVVTGLSSKAGIPQKTITAITSDVSCRFANSQE